MKISKFFLLVLLNNYEIKNTKMKKIKNVLPTILLMVTLVTTFQSCNQELDNQVNAENDNLISQLEYLDMDTSNITNKTELQKLILQKAIKRVDTFVILENKVYKLKISSGNQIKISERLFEYLKTRINQTNANLNDLNVFVDYRNPKVLRINNNLIINRNIRLKSPDKEFVSGGVNDVEFYWWGYEVYLSNTSLKNIARGATAAAVASVFIPEPSITKISAVLCGLTALAAGILEEDYPNGVCVTYYLGVVGYVTQQQ